MELALKPRLCIRAHGYIRKCLMLSFSACFVASSFTSRVISMSTEEGLSSTAPTPVTTTTPHVAIMAVSRAAETASTSSSVALSTSTPAHSLVSAWTSGLRYFGRSLSIPTLQCEQYFRLGVRVASTGAHRWYSSPAGAAPGSQIGLREGNIIIRSCLQVVNSR